MKQWAAVLALSVAVLLPNLPFIKATVPIFALPNFIVLQKEMALHRQAHDI